MTQQVDYYIAIQSPWTYLGHERFAGMLRKSGAQVRVRPIDLGQVFPVSGGLPLPKRAPQRQAYRLVELTRWSDHLKLPLNLHPKFFPVPGDAASRLVIGVARQDGEDAAMKLSGALMAAVWAEERNINDEATLAALLAQSGLDTQRLEQSKQPEVQQAYEAHTQAAIDAGVFGSPSYVVDGEIFWGQDRLEFLERKLRG